MMRPIPQIPPSNASEKSIRTPEQVVEEYTAHLTKILDELPLETSHIDKDLAALEGLSVQLSKGKVKPVCTKVITDLQRLYTQKREAPQTAGSALTNLAASCLRVSPEARITPIQAMSHPAFKAIAVEKEVAINEVDVRPFLMTFTPLESACYESELRRFAPNKQLKKG